MKSEVHTQRLMYYDDSTLNVTAALYENIASTGSSFVVQAIHDLRLNSETGLPELSIIWKVFESTDSTWEPLSIMAEDIPVLVKQF